MKIISYEIEVIDVRRFKRESLLNSDNFVYCGRSCGDWKGSVLGNKFKIGIDGSREEVIEKYRIWLWSEYKRKGVVFDELMRLRKIYLKDKGLILGCWCGEGRCHCDVIKRFLWWNIEYENISNTFAN